MMERILGIINRGFNTPALIILIIHFQNTLLIHTLVLDIPIFPHVKIAVYYLCTAIYTLILHFFNTRLCTMGIGLAIVWSVKVLNKEQ